jgi:hypothetical protein
MLPVAAAIFVFDAIVQNADRRVDNANCLVKGNEIRIIDHEMTFTHGLVATTMDAGRAQGPRNPGISYFQGAVASQGDRFWSDTRRMVGLV